MALGMSLLERSPDAVAVLRGADHLLEYANESFCELAGQPSERLLSCAFADAFRDLNRTPHSIPRPGLRDRAAGGVAGPRAPYRGRANSRPPLRGLAGAGIPQVAVAGSSSRPRT